MRRLVALAMTAALLAVALAALPAIAKREDAKSLFTVCSSDADFKSQDRLVCNRGTRDIVALGIGPCAETSWGCQVANHDIAWDFVMRLDCTDGSGYFFYRQWGSGGPASNDVQEWQVVSGEIELELGGPLGTYQPSPSYQDLAGSGDAYNNGEANPKDKKACDFYSGAFWTEE